MKLCKDCKWSSKEGFPPHFAYRYVCYSEQAGATKSVITGETHGIECLTARVPLPHGNYQTGSVQPGRCSAQAKFWEEKPPSFWARLFGSGGPDTRSPDLA